MSQICQVRANACKAPEREIENCVPGRNELLLIRGLGFCLPTTEAEGIAAKERIERKERAKVGAAEAREQP